MDTISLEAQSAECLALCEALAIARRQGRPEAEQRAVAEAYISAVHAYQQAKYGRVRVQLRVAHLLR